MAHHEGWIGVASRALMQLRALRKRHTLIGAQALIAEVLAPALEGQSILLARTRSACADEFRRARKLDADILLRIEFLGEVPAPGLQMVHPGFDGVAMTSQPVRIETSTPTIVAEQGHWRALPVRSALGAVQQIARHAVVPVGKDIRLDRDAIAEDALHREAPAVDLRGHVLDHHPARARIDKGGHGRSTRGLAHPGCRKSVVRGGRRRLSE